MRRGKVRQESGKSVAVVAIAVSDILRYLAAIESGQWARSTSGANGKGTIAKGGLDGARGVSERREG